MKKNLIFCYILAAVITVSATDYCDVKCVFNGTERTHIRCGDDGSFGPECPPTARNVPMTESRKNTILHELNVLRNFVAGGGNSTYSFRPACRMRRIQWNDGLAENAVPNTNKCKTWFDGCHTADTFKSSGQAILEVYAPRNYDDDKCINIFLVGLTNMFFVNKFGDCACDRNTHVGCAVTTALSTATVKGVKTKIYWVACNFATDIHKGDSMYEVCESPAEKCKNKPVDPYPNLCGVGETDEEESL